MSDSHKRKTELVLPRAELAEFLTKMGKDIDSGAITIGESKIELENFTGFEVKVKPLVEDLLRVKVKVKYPKRDTFEGLSILVDEDEDGSWPMQSGSSAPPRPKYDDLKDRMKAEFKAISAGLLLNRLPEEALAKAFLRDCELMTTYSDKGDEYYPAFMSKVEEWTEAYENKDVEALKTANAGLDELKKACHARFK